MFGRRVLADAMAQIENMAGAGSRWAEALERGSHFAANPLGRREQYVGVEVALQGHLRADPLARLTEVDGPVQPEHVGADLRHRLEPRPAALREDDARDARARMF